MCGYYSRAATIRCAATIRINTVTMKALYLLNETVLSKSVSWKPRKTSEEQAGMSNLSYKHE